MKKLDWLRSMRQFLILWGSQAVSSLGSAMTSYALIIWVYGQKGTATSVALLSFCTYLPSIAFSFIAGTLADRWDKKRTMLICDLIAAIGTLTVFLLYSTDGLEIWHLYVVNLLISFMNAFQGPASYVATSLLVPKEHYVRASGLQVFSGSIVTILTPALAAAVMGLGGLSAVFIADLATFAFAFSVLLLCIRLPDIQGAAGKAREPFLRACTEGLRFLREHRALLHIIVVFAFVNLLAYLTGFGILPAMILARTGGSEGAYGAVASAIGLGTLAGSVLVTVARPAKNQVRIVFLSCAVSFALCNPVLAVGRTLPVWMAAGFLGYLPLPFLNANLPTLMRRHVPIEMQGRVFSARDTLQYSTIPLGLFLGGFLADNVFEPLMLGTSRLQGILSAIVGTGPGAGMAVMFLITGIVGCVTCLISLRDPAYKELG